MDRETSSLLLRSNRTLGTRLVEAGLCTLNDIDEANELFSDRVRAGDIKKASLLRILIFEKQVINESELLDFLIENHSIAGICLDAYELNYELIEAIDIKFYWATWTLVLDQIDGHYLIASCYYLSDIAKQFWEERLGTTITWYVCSVSDMESYLEIISKQIGKAEVKS